MASDRPLCFVLMPFGIKKDPASSLEIDFDAIYEQAIRPGAEAAGLDVIRADEERTGGIIHKPMFERLLLCEYAIADLTTNNANVYYELGVRHAARPSTTLAMFADSQRLPFDLTFLRALPYRLGASGRFEPEHAAELTSKLTARLVQLRAEHQQSTDSPLFQLLTEYRAPEVAHLKTDVFRERVEYSARVKDELAKARAASDRAAVERLESGLGSFDGVESGILVDLYLTWRALSAWDRMVALYEQLPAMLQRTVLVREQLGFALNRLGRRDEALRVLESVSDEQGPSSETFGLIGRVYKDQWLDAKERNADRLAAGYLDRAIVAYRRGFEADCRDSYPGVNAATLLDIKGTPEALGTQGELLPVVRFAAKQKLRGGKAGYWDYATMLEVSVLQLDEAGAMQYLTDALSRVRESWEPKTTSNNLQIIRDARVARGHTQPWLDEIIAELERAAAISSKS